MSNPPRQKGTGFEVRSLSKYVRRIWPEAERAPLKGTLDFGDYVGVNGWLIEAKKRNRWDLRQWIRDILKKTQRDDPTAPWVLIFAGDKRQPPSMDLVAMPAEQYFDQLARLKTLEKLDE